MSREADAVSKLQPTDGLVRFRHYGPGEVVDAPHAPHPGHRFVKVPIDGLWEAIDRCAREFAAPALATSTPEPISVVKRRR